MNELFENKDKLNCPIKKCELRNIDCQVLYIGSELIILPKNGFDFTMISSNNDFNKKKILACISCSNGFQTIFHHNFEVSFIRENDDGIPTQIFTIINLAFSIKVKNI